MNLLLDTHALLWWLADDDGLGDAARRAIAQPDNLVAVSAASVWEVAIKRRLGKLTAPDDLVAMINAGGFQPLDVTPVHAQVAGDLPLHHRDPFDRMLIAQAQSDDLLVVTRDAAFERYDVPVLAC